ncbi:MAG: YcgN family cysteine cluster protein [Rhodospirillales bacterium]
MAGAGKNEPFWRRKTLGDMTRAEWESLCDGCAKCCLEKLEDVETGEISYTNVACRLLDLKACRCTNYEQRQRYVPDCVMLTPDNIAQLHWMPSTCAYRLLAEGKDLPDWHPLVSGDPDSAHRSKNSVRGRVVSERDAGDLEDHIVTWPK